MSSTSFPKCKAVIAGSVARWPRRGSEKRTSRPRVLTALKKYSNWGGYEDLYMQQLRSFNKKKNQTVMRRSSAKFVGVLMLCCVWSSMNRPALWPSTPDTLRHPVTSPRGP